MNKHQRMAWVFRMLSYFCPDYLYEEIEGDLIQKFESDLLRYGAFKARRRLLINAICFFRPGILFRNNFSIKFPYHMLRHFFKIFLRTSLRSPSYTLINISGLAIGLTCGIFTLLWVMDELAYDQVHIKKDQIYSVKTNATYPDNIFTFDGNSGRLAEGLKELQEVDATCRSSFAGKVLINYKNTSFYEQGVYADASLFDIFTFQLIEGSLKNPLPDNNAIVITEELAIKYFKEQSAVGKLIRVDNKTDARVTAVIRDLPGQSTLTFSFVLPYAIYEKSDPYNQEWGAWTGGNTYVTLHADADKDVVNEKISRLITHPKIWPRWGDNVEPFLFPMKDWRLRSEFQNGKQVGGRITYIKAFAVIALFILLIACVNFMNLTTARAMNRGKEIGVRKVIGAARRSITMQFLGESVLISFVSLLFALGFVHLLLPYFNLMTSKNMAVDYGNMSLVISMLGITLFTGVVAGSYPSIFLSSLRAMNLLKDKISGRSGVGVRKALVVFQFSLSTIFIISAFVVYNQIEYMRHKNLGFDKDNALYITASSNVVKRYESLRQQLIGQSGIRSVSRAADEPMNIQTGLEMCDDCWPGKTKADNVAFRWLFCDEEYLKAFKFELLEGRNFSADFAADSNNYLIIEEAVRRMRLQHPVGQEIKADVKGTIIGVLKDFHSQGPGQAILPVVISMRPTSSNLIFIHYDPERLKEAMAHLESVYKKIEPDFPMEFAFLDDSFDKAYRTELLFRKLSALFMIIAVFLSCLGLLGLASFLAERRIKEIGIRKVLGASVPELVIMLCRDFIRLICVSLCMGFPLAWWIGTQFLKTYPLRVTIGFSEFAFTGISLLLIALVTVSYQSAKAAMSNPVKTLQSE